MLDSCWLVLFSWWLVLDSCRFVLTRIDSCWLVLVLVYQNRLDHSWVPLPKFAHFSHYLRFTFLLTWCIIHFYFKKLMQYWLWIRFHNKQLLFHLLYIFFHLFLQNILTTYRIGSWNRTKTYPLQCRQEWKPYAGVQPRISQVRRGFLE